MIAPITPQDYLYHFADLDRAMFKGVCFPCSFSYEFVESLGTAGQAPLLTFAGERISSSQARIYASPCNCELLDTGDEIKQVIRFNGLDKLGPYTARVLQPDTPGTVTVMLVENDG